MLKTIFIFRTWTPNPGMAINKSHTRITSNVLKKIAIISAGLNQKIPNLGLPEPQTLYFLRKFLHIGSEKLAES